MHFVLPHLCATDTVLDIGAGAGRHALFLAQQVAQVIAVEPSPSMRQQLEARQANIEGAPLTVLPAAWPDITTPQCDIAICSHVLYGVREVGPFLTAMDAAARRACFVLLGMQQPSFALAPFWERINGTPRLPLPGALECLNVLYQLGIPAQLALVPASHFVFAGREEALEDIRWRLGLSETILDDAALLSLIDELLESDSSGGLRPRYQPGYAAVLWWTHDEAT
jgi:SAM-dependent methyltransferase